MHTSETYNLRPVRLLRVWVSEGKQTLNSKGWEFPCPYNLIGGLPESLTQGLLVGKLLVGGLGVAQLLTKRRSFWRVSCIRNALWYSIPHYDTISGYLMLRAIILWYDALCYGTEQHIMACFVMPWYVMPCHVTHIYYTMLCCAVLGYAMSRCVELHRVA